MKSLAKRALKNEHLNDEIVRLRGIKDSKGRSIHTYAEIADRLGISKAQCNYYYDRCMGKKRWKKREKIETRVVEVDEVDRRAVFFTVWLGREDIPVVAEKKKSLCGNCPYETECRYAVAHGEAIACEKVLVGKDTL